jgi:hypothetical protein
MEHNSRFHFGSLDSTTPAVALASLIGHMMRHDPTTISSRRCFDGLL